MLWTNIFILVIATYFFASRRRSFIQYLALPSGANFFWGHEKIVFTHQPGEAFRNWAKALGCTFRIKAAFGAPDILVLCDPEGIAHILQKRIYDYHHSAVVRPRIARLLGKGLGWVEGEAEHKRMKRLVNSALTSEGVRNMAQEVREAMSGALNDLINTMQNNTDANEIDIVDWAGRAALNVIGRVAFLHDFEGGNSLDARRILGGRKRGSSAVMKHTGFVTLMLLRRFPLLNSLPIFAIKGQGLAKSIIQSEVALKLIERNKPLIDKLDNKQEKDLLSRLLRAEAEGRISHQELLEQISTLIISGHETTTQTLAFTIWELSRHPNVQQRLRSEIEGFEKEPTYDDFQTNLPFLDAVLKETLRLYPALAYMERVATKQDTVPLRFPVKLSNGEVANAVHIQPGQTVIIPIIAIHRAESVWNDPDEFRPDRWLEKLPPAEVLCSGWANILAFSDGPRSCIGMRLAIFQYKVILSSLISRFSFEDTGANITLQISSSLQAWTIGKEQEGPQLPVLVRML